jgi:flavin-dependent dehydrogenase
VSLGIDELLLEDTSAGIFEFGLMKYGYAWIFPRRDYVGVGIGARADKLQSHKETLRSVLLNWGVKGTNREGHWHVLPTGGFSRKIYADRIMLVGDAAGFVDPFFGEGIGLAIRSATYAAETARVALDQGDCTEVGLKSYWENCEADFGHSLRSELRWMSLVYRYPNVLIKPFAMSAKLTDIAWNYSSSYFAHHTRSRLQPVRK